MPTHIQSNQSYEYISVSWLHRSVNSNLAAQIVNSNLIKTYFPRFKLVL